MINDNYSFDLFEIASNIDSLKHKKQKIKVKWNNIFEKDRFNKSGFNPFIQKLARVFGFLRNPASDINCRCSDQCRNGTREFVNT